MTIIRKGRTIFYLNVGPSTGGFSGYICWRNIEHRHRKADPMLLTIRKTGPTSKHPPLHNCEPLSVVSFKDRTDGPCQRSSRSNPTNGLDDPSNPFQPSCSTVQLEITRRSVGIRKHQFISVTQSCPILWDPMDCSTQGFPVHHQLLEPTQIHVIESVMPPNLLSSVPFSSHLQPFLASGSFPRSRFFASGGQSIGVSASASVLPVTDFL